MNSLEFPAILLAGPPNCGKSVLSHQLTQRLRKLGIPHYLVRAAPDGEGNWFLEGPYTRVRLLRERHKSTFTPAFTGHMVHRVRDRHLPLLVDVGGKPRGDQWDILASCTHAVLLYRNDEDRDKWLSDLDRLDLELAAVLRSDLHAPDRIETGQPYLSGRIGGLDRENPRSGAAIDALTRAITGIVAMESRVVESFHTAQAGLPLIHERQLARQVGARFQGDRAWWSPGDLAAACALVPPGVEGAIYGPGPVWLAAALAAHTLPAGCSMFDTRLGWMKVPDVVVGTNPSLKVRWIRQPELGAVLADVELNGLLEEPGEQFTFPEMPASEGCILSGRLPRWLFAALTRYLADHTSWAAVFDANAGHAVVVFSRSKERSLGAMVPI